MNIKSFRKKWTSYKYWQRGLIIGVLLLLVGFVPIIGSPINLLFTLLTLPLTLGIVLLFPMVSDTYFFVFMRLLIPIVAALIGLMVDKKWSKALIILGIIGVMIIVFSLVLFIYVFSSLTKDIPL